MLHALIHGKLSRSQENMEDLLTSMTFGALSYVSPGHLWAFLRHAVTLEGAQPLLDLPPVTHAEYRFWPWLTTPEVHPCEPDVLIELVHADDSRTDVLVEAKFHSGKSSEEDVSRPIEPSSKAIDQLAREWENLAATSKVLRRHVIYVTADVVMPRPDLAASHLALVARGRVDHSLLWLSFRTLHASLEGAEQKLLGHIRKTLERLELIPFTGIPGDIVLPVVDWRFETATAPMNWNVVSPRVDWSWSEAPSMDWNWNTPVTSNCEWRFGHV